jgi:hypothetical protein
MRKNTGVIYFVDAMRARCRNRDLDHIVYVRDYLMKSNEIVKKRIS